MMTDLWLQYLDRCLTASGSPVQTDVFNFVPPLLPSIEKIQMVDAPAWGLSSNEWVAIAGVGAFLLAIATFILAWVTNAASKRAIEFNTKETAGQIKADTENVEKQIKASAEGIQEQVKAANDAAIIQARASSISNNRQQWINAVRDEVTGYLTETDHLLAVRQKWTGIKQEEELLRTDRAIGRHIFKVTLLINHNEMESTNLVDMLTATRGGLPDDYKQQLISHTQKILKKEWERVKSGE